MDPSRESSPRVRHNSPVDRVLLSYRNSTRSLLVAATNSAISHASRFVAMPWFVFLKILLNCWRDTRGAATCLRLRKIHLIVLLLGIVISCLRCIWWQLCHLFLSRRYLFFFFLLIVIRGLYLYSLLCYFLRVKANSFEPKWTLWYLIIENFPRRDSLRSTWLDVQGWSQSRIFYSLACWSRARSAGAAESTFN